jgi:hypothetical protein
LETLTNLPLTSSPELLLPFKQDSLAVTKELQEWTRGVWLHPTDFTSIALTSHLRKVYLPMWLVDGSMEATWNAQAGFEYQVASSTEAYNSGRWFSSQVNETRVRWESRAGRLQRSYENLAVPALENHSQLISGLGSYPLQEASPYDSSTLDQISIQIPNLSAEQAWPQARTQFELAAASDCMLACGAERIDQVSIQADYQKLNWTLLLLPVYYTNYHDDQGVFHPVLVNGNNGHVFGVRRASQSQGWRWTGTLAGIGLACLLLAVLQSLVISGVSPSQAISSVLFILGALVTLLSPLPAIWAWQFNRNTQE